VTRDEFDLVKQKIGQLSGIPDQLYEFIGVREQFNKIWDPNVMEVSK
jgi:hypothetical protein